MSNTSLLMLLLSGYLLFLVGISYWSWSSNPSTNNQNSNNHSDYLFGNGFGFWLSFFGVAASLFSTFTLEGMPSFFKNHGIASWVFLGVTDVFLATLLLFFGLKMRRFSRTKLLKANSANTEAEVATNEKSVKNLTEWLKHSAMPKWVIVFFVAAVTIFMIPYITIQIKGTAVLLQTAIPFGETHLTWSILMVCLMLAYSWFGGIRAIFITDVVQGLFILLTVWAIAFFAIQASGGIPSLFAQVASIEPALLSSPGPKGVLNWQFLLVSFISIIMMPYVQPQLATRILITKDDKAFIRSTMALAIFAILVILPTLFIGLRSVIISQSVTDGHFLLNLITSDAPVFFYALFIVGVLAAAMSTADSQLMAIGTEWSSTFMKTDIQDNPKSKVWVKSVSVIVAIIALFLAQSSFKSLILFSISSFIGTSLLLPIIIACTVSKYRGLLIVSSVISVIIFLLTLMTVIPKMLAGIRIELLLYSFEAVCLGLVWYKDRLSSSTVNDS